MGLKIIIATPLYLSSVFVAPAQPFFQHGTRFPVAMVGTQPLDITESTSVSSLLPSAEQDIDTPGNWIHKETWIICYAGTSLSAQMDTEERATTQVTTVSLNDCVTILQVVTQGQKSYPDLVFINPWFPTTWMRNVFFDIKVNVFLQLNNNAFIHCNYYYSKLQHYTTVRNRKFHISNRCC